MNYKDKLNIFESIELDSIRYMFENPTSFTFQKEIELQKKIDSYWIELTMIVTGSNIKPNFGSSVIINHVAVKDFKLWLNDDEEESFSDSDLLKLQKILTKKMKELL